MSEKVLVVVSEQRVTLYHTTGVEVVCIVDGENVELPDDWTDLPLSVVHSMPIYLGAGEMFGDREGEFVADLSDDPREKDQNSPILARESSPQCPETELPGTNGQGQHTTARLNKRVGAVVDEQADDDGLWFQAKTAPEAYLQQELRRLHTVIESEAIIPGRASKAERCSGLMKAPYCPDCDNNHPRSVGCDGKPATCDLCGEPWGQLHERGCRAQIGGEADMDIVGGTEALENP